jgi:serine/threonine-protein kinase
VQSPVAQEAVPAHEPAAADGLRTCRTCGAIYRKQFARCPSDGGEIVVVHDDPLIGRTVGSFAIDELLGEGAMGRVYRAHHARLAAKRYALKVLHGDHASDATMRIRFAKEAEAVSRLAHPNVVTVADFGRSAEGLFFIAMELVNGVSLADLLDAGPLDPARVVRLARGLCAGLTHARAHHLIHRDLKPDNVLVVIGADGEVPRIVDFGIALATDREDARLTSTGFTMGTPAYVAPEQAVIGKAVDHRADLYALGVTMYEMLTGALPFTGEPMEIVLAKATRAAPCRPPPALAQIVDRLLARDPDALPRRRRGRRGAGPSVAGAGPAGGRGTTTRRWWPMGAAAVALLGVASAAWWSGASRDRGGGARAGGDGVHASSADRSRAGRACRSSLRSSPPPRAAERAPERRPERGPACAASRPRVTAACRRGAAAGRHAAAGRRATATRPGRRGRRRRRGDGALATGAARKGVDRALPALRGCVAGATPGTVTVSFTIGEARRPQQVSARGGSAATQACVAAAIGGVRTDAAPDVGDARVTARLAFTP